MAQLPPDNALPLAELASFNANLTLGALYIGSFFSTFLAGVTSIQTYIYYQRPDQEKDSKLFRGVIFFLWILDMLHAAFFSHAVYVYGVTFYLDPSELIQPIWSLSADMLLGSVSTALMTCIMTSRIWRLSNRSWWMMAFVVMVIALNTCAFATSLAVTIISWVYDCCVIVGILSQSVRTRQILPTFQAFHERYAWLWYTCFGSRVIIDFFVAIILASLLSKYRTRLRRTNDVIHFLILYCVNTGAITSATSITVIITFAVLPSSFITFCCTVLVPKFMLNSMLSLLNSRQFLREKNQAGVVSIHLSNITSSDRGSSVRTPAFRSDRRVDVRAECDGISGSSDVVKPTSPDTVGTVLVIA